MCGCCCCCFYPHSKHPLFPSFLVPTHPLRFTSVITSLGNFPCELLKHFCHSKSFPIFYVTNHHTLNGLNSTYLLFHSFCVSRVQAWCSWIPCLGSHKLWSSCELGCSLIWKLAQGRAASKLTKVVNGIHFLLSLGLRLQLLSGCVLKTSFIS